MEIRLPQFAFPLKDEQNPCPCQDRPMELTFKSCELFWEVEDGAVVSEGEPIASLEVEKKTLELLAPATGKLAKAVSDGDGVDYHTIIGTIETEVALT